MSDKELEAMKNFIQDTFAKIDPDVEINLDGDADLENYVKGAPLSLDDIRKLSPGEVIWTHHTDCGRPRFVGAQKVLSVDPKGGTYAFGDGSCFVTEIYDDEYEAGEKAFYACDHVLKFYTAVRK